MIALYFFSKALTLTLNHVITNYIFVKIKEMLITDK